MNETGTLSSFTTDSLVLSTRFNPTSYSMRFFQLQDRGKLRNRTQKTLSKLNQI